MILSGNLLTDGLFWALIVITLIGSLVQAALQSRFKKYSELTTASGQNAENVARSILNSNDCANVAVMPTPGNLTDHFDPRSETVNLSAPVYGSNSVAAVSVAAHESGHAIQHQQGYAMVKIRSALVPVINFSSNLIWPLFLIGVIMGGAFGGMLADIGIVLFAVVFLFHLVTLPVELNASNRALKILQDGAYLNQDELPAAKKVLSAAAFTYVVAAMSSLIQLIRMVSISRNRRR